MVPQQPGQEGVCRLKSRHCLLKHHPCFCALISAEIANAISASILIGALREGRNYNGLSKQEVKNLTGL
jgi:hypothetical protein